MCPTSAHSQAFILTAPTCSCSMAQLCSPHLHHALVSDASLWVNPSTAYPSTCSNAFTNVPITITWWNYTRCAPLHSRRSQGATWMNIYRPAGARSSGSIGDEYSSWLGINAICQNLAKWLNEYHNSHYACREMWQLILNLSSGETEKRKQGSVASDLQQLHTSQGPNPEVSPTL